jgi:hypothetical protein
MTVSGGQIQGVAGAGSVVIENFTIYNRPVEEPAATGTEPIAPCPYPGLAYFGPDGADRFFRRDAAITRIAEAVGSIAPPLCPPCNPMYSGHHGSFAFAAAHQYLRSRRPLMTLSRRHFQSNLIEPSGSKVHKLRALVSAQ